MSELNPTLNQVIARAVERGMATLRVCLPAKIVSFDPATQTAKVKPLLQEIALNESGEEINESLPVISNVPVQFVGGNGYAATFPVAAEDPCLLIFSDRSISNWQERGTDVDPVELHRHDFNDAIALLGVRSKPGKLTEFDSARAVFGNKGPRVAVDGSTVHVGVAHNEAGAQQSVRGDAYRAAEDQMLTLIDTAATAASSSLNVAGGALNTAAGLNAIPLIGGIPAAPAFVAAANAIIGAATALQSIKAAITSFKAQGVTYLQPKVKIP